MSKSQNKPKPPKPAPTGNTGTKEGTKDTTKKK